MFTVNLQDNFELLVTLITNFTIYALNVFNESESDFNLLVFPDDDANSSNPIEFVSPPTEKYKPNQAIALRSDYDDDETV